MSHPISRRFQLCTIEPATDITSGPPNISGSLVLSRYDDSFQLHWTPLDGTPTQHVTAALSSPSRIPDDVWQVNEGFKVECGDISQLVLHQNPLSLTLFRSDRPGSRTFRFCNAEFVSMMELIEQLISNGIAVPSPNPDYALTFYSRCQRNVYPYTPPQLHLSVDSVCDISVFWDELHKFFQALIIHLDTTDMLPKDTMFPLDRAAEAVHNRVLRKIDDYARTIPKYEKIRVDNWQELFDDSGRVKDPAMFKKRVFHEGIEQELMPQALPFIFGVFALDSTEEERKKLRDELHEEFSVLLQQVSSFDQEQIENNKRLDASFRIIKHDVNRTDRSLLAFQNDNGNGLKMLTNLLRTYCIFNPLVGYLQGMNDLFVPMMMAFLPDWNEEGDPIDKDGNVIDYVPFMSTVFWCFDGMMRNTDHIRILGDVTTECTRTAEQVHKIITKVSPIAGIWMKRVGIGNLLWCYSDLVLLFKRSLPDHIWSVWLQLNSSPHPEHWLTYFVAAVLVLGFDQLTHLPNQQLTTMMEAFPRILAKIGADQWKIGVTALWLAEMVPLEAKSAQQREEVQMSDFKFFETSWTGLSECRKTMMDAPK